MFNLFYCLSVLCFFFLFQSDQRQIKVEIISQFRRFLPSYFQALAHRLGPYMRNVFQVYIVNPLAQASYLAYSLVRNTN